ncbi:MAG: Extradiol ring-cleavage dioxygenase class protein subunit [Candidatus Berkelbacteria bacterium]|nr:Extradiol ring-cleavage dioxygenase class protein subunit [Candidatus Berkelbacteria bacterium]
MSLNFASISPHPPIIIPGIGSNEDLHKVGGTITGLRKLANHFREAEIETLIVISPHTLTYPDRFNICGMKKLFGSFASFGAPDFMMEFNNDFDLAVEINSAADSHEINTLLYNNNGEFFEMDHGLMVPLYYISKIQETSLKILPIAFSNLDRYKHFTFGQVIGEIIKKYPSRVGVIASGDLSHRLIQGAPGGYSKIGIEFDKKIVADLKENKVQEILYYDEEFVEGAGECGYRSILILLGILDGLKIKPEVLSYEGPFGVGYLVANYKFPEDI